MSFSRLMAVTPAMLFLTACAVAEPVPYAQQDHPVPTIIYVSSDTLPEQFSQDTLTKVAEASHVTPRLKPRTLTSVPGYKDNTQATFIRTAAQMTGDSKPIYWNTHVVEKGDTAYSLSRRFCSRIEDVRRYNDLNSQYALKVGQPIVLPRTTC